MPVIYSTHTLHPRATEMLSGPAMLRIASALDAATLAARAARPTSSSSARRCRPPVRRRAEELRAAIRHGAGLDMIPIEAATKAGVLVANVPGVNARSVAEHVFFVTLALLRRFRMMDRDLRQQRLARRPRSRRTDARAAGRTLGVVGMGNVGKAVMATARAGFGLDVIANSRNPKSLPDDVRFVSVDELVAESDIVVLCCPLTPETTGLLSRERIARMRPGCDPGQRLARRRSSTKRPDRSARRRPDRRARRSTSSPRSRCRPTIPISRSTM